MAKRKLQHFEENRHFPHLFQLQYEDLVQGFQLKGKWNEDFFNNNHPIILELGCGKGEYAVSLARKYPANNYIGVDLKGARLYTGCKASFNEQLKNVAFVRSRIQMIELYFGEKEVDEIWITFPDPQPRNSRAKKRLTSPEFLARYSKVLKNEGIIHLKTDSRELFDYTLEVIEEYKHHLIYKTFDLYKDKPEDDVLITQTFYEKMFLEAGKKINYLKFRMK